MNVAIASIVKRKEVLCFAKAKELHLLKGLDGAARVRMVKSLERRNSWNERESQKWQ